MLVTKREPTPGYNDAFSVGTPKWAFWEKTGQKHRKTTISPLGETCFSGYQTDRKLCLGSVIWMLHIGRARHPGPGEKYFPPGQLSVEFVNVGGWLT